MQNNEARSFLIRVWFDDEDKCGAALKRLVEGLTGPASLRVQSLDDERQALLVGGVLSVSDEGHLEFNVGDDE